MSRSTSVHMTLTPRFFEQIVEDDAIPGLQGFSDPRNKIPKSAASVISTEPDNAKHAFTKPLRERRLAAGGGPHDDVDDRIVRRLHGSATPPCHALGDHVACDLDKHSHEGIAQGHGTESDG